MKRIRQFLKAFFCCPSCGHFFRTEGIGCKQCDDHAADMRAW